MEIIPTRTLIRQRIEKLHRDEKLMEETIAALTDLIENEGYSISPWVRTCLRGLRQNVNALFSSPET